MRLLVILSFFCSTMVCAQNSSNKIYNAKELKKGFYKSYDEYINNSPSVLKDFTVKPKTLRKSDSAIICVDFELANEDEKVGSIWGFCDGKDVFIKRSTGLNSNKYWRVEHIGIHPYYYYFEKGFGFGPGLMRLATLAIEAFKDEDLVLALKDENDKNYNANERNVRKLLVGNTELLQQFEKDMEDAKNTKTSSEEEVKRVTAYKKYILQIDALKQR